MSKKKALKIFVFALLLVGGLKAFTTTTYAKEFIDYRNCPLGDEGFAYHKEYHLKNHRNGMMHENYYNRDNNRNMTKNPEQMGKNNRGYGMCHR